MSVRLADRSFQHPIGIAEYMLVEVGKFTFPMDFVILEMEEDSKVPLILGRPFLHTVDVIALGRMPFGLCNAPATFQRCMLAIFHDMIEESVEVFMEDFSVFGNPFDNYLKNLDKMLQHCKDANLVLNWKKCNFMVKEGIILGHKVSGAGLEVDKAKIDVISKLPPPTNVKGIRSFLGHAAFSLNLYLNDSDLEYDPLAIINQCTSLRHLITLPSCGLATSGPTSS
ncbi:reverse transcriptase domain-containing protein [Tanacetum coccineum]